MVLLLINLVTLCNLVQEEKYFALFFCDVHFNKLLIITPAPDTALGDLLYEKILLSEYIHHRNEIIHKYN